MLDIDTLTAKIHDQKTAILLVGMQLAYAQGAIGSTKILNDAEALLEDAAGKVECIHIGSGINKPILLESDKRLKAVHPFINDRLNSASSIFSYNIPEGHAICLKDNYTGDGFDNTGLKEYLREHGIDTVIICGLYDNNYVIDTGESAAQNGFNVAYLSDLIRGNRPDLHSANQLEQLAIHQAMYADSGLVIQSKDLKPILEAIPARTQRAVAANQSYAELSVPAAN